METHTTQLVLLIGICILASVILRNLLRRIKLPGLIGFIVFGFLIRFVDTQLPILGKDGMEVFAVLGKLGIICLLFKVGLESNLAGLRKQLGRAGLIWTGNIVISGGAGFALARYALSLDLLPSLFVGVAMTATSIGVSVRVWDEAGKLQTPSGQLLLDVAELDDLSGVVFMAFLFGLAPLLLEHGHSEELVSVGLKTGGIIALKLIAFGGACYAFARYGERKLTSFSARLRPKPDPMLFLLAVGMLAAALAGWLGFSVAIGAFFAGLVFSGDPKAVKMERSFGALHELFVPFFFIHLGLLVPVSHLATGLQIGLLLFLVAAGGKFFGGFIPGRFLADTKRSALLGLSLLPRAEITMVVMSYGRTLGERVIPTKVFVGMIWVVLLTCIAGTVSTGFLINKIKS